MYKIAITGKANSGKNTLAKLIANGLIDHANDYMYPSFLAFADPIKEMVRRMYPGLPRKFLYGSSKFRNEIIPGAFKDGVPLTVRQLLIDLGTDVGRRYNPQVWLDNFDHRFHRIEKRSRNNMIDKSTIVIVTDVRFRNEFDHLSKQDFYQIRLYRDVGTPTKVSVDGHVSETNQDAIKDEEFNYILFNNKTIKDLKLDVKNNIIPQILNR